MRTKDDAVKETKNEQPSGGGTVSAGGSYSKSSGSSGSSSSKANSTKSGSSGGERRGVYVTHGNTSRSSDAQYQVGGGAPRQDSITDYQRGRSNQRKDPSSTIGATWGPGNNGLLYGSAEIDRYLKSGNTDSGTTQKYLDAANKGADEAQTEKEQQSWLELANSLSTQLEADQKRENRSWLGKAWDSVTGAFQRPEREEQGELTDTQKAYRQAAEEEQMYAGYATDPLSAASFAPLAEQRDELAEAVKAENREAGREVYAGMMPEDRMADATESWLGGRGAGTAAGVAGGMYAVDSMFYDNDEIRELTQRKWLADQALLNTGDQKFKEESDALQAQIDEAQQRANENGENGTVLGDAAGMLLESARGMQGEADQKWQDVTEDLSEAEKFGLNVAKTGADVTADIVENAVAPGVGTMRMYLGAAGSGAMEQAGRENNDPDSIATATITRAASAWLSTKLVGGMESAYGQSILGGITEQAFANASPAVQAAAKTLLNTEGVEEGLEDILNYAGDLILNLDEEARLSWDEVKQDALVGYVLGVLTNGLSAGINYNSKARHALAEEAMEFAQSGLSIEEAAEIGKESTKEDVVMKPGNPAADETQGQTATEPQGTDATLQDTGIASEVTPESTTNAGVEETAAEPQETAPAAAPAQTASGPAADSTAYTGPELPNASYGGGSTVKVGNTKVPVHFAVVPIGELNVSHDIYGNENTNYPSELQPRDRSRGTAQAQAMNIGNNLDPGELEWSNNATTGAPIIRPDGVVISGNGRTLGISYALQNGKGEDYIQHIRDNAARFGIDPNSVGEDSVLVRVADGDYNWQAMAEQANVSDVSRMNASEQARVDAERLSRYPEILDKLVPNDTGDLRTGENADFVKEFLQAVVPESEQGDVWTQEGGLSKNGLTRVQNAVFQMAYGDPSLMARLSESLDNNMKNVSNSLLALAPKVANLETSVENGMRYIGVRDAILDGVKIFETAKNRGVDVQKVVDQISLDNNAGAEAVFIAEFLQDNAKSAKQIRTFLNAMADTAESFGDPSQVGFFDTGDTEYTSKDVLEGAIAKYEQETGNQLRRPDYDFYGDGGDLLDVGTDRESESGNPEEPDTAADRAAAGAGEDTGSRADRGEVSELARRMEAGEVSEDKYMSLLQSEDGRAQLADALGLPNSDMKTVVDGLSLYLILQEQYQTMLAEQQQGTQNTAETATGAQETSTGVNYRVDETKATEGTLNTQNAQESANPFFETEENTDTGSQNVNQNADNVNENANTDKSSQNEESNPNSTAENPKQWKVPPEEGDGSKISRHFTNTLRKTDAAPESWREMFRYLPKSEAQSLANATAKLANDRQATIRELTEATSWNGEQVDAAYLIQGELRREAARTGDMKAYQAWLTLKAAKQRETARGLQAIAKQARPNSESVLEAGLARLSDLRAEAEEKTGDSGNSSGKTAAIAKAEKDLTDVSKDLLDIEIKAEDAEKSGKSETEALDSVKNDLIDLSVKINNKRGVSLFGDMRNRKQQEKFREMLSGEDAEYIRRFVACQAAGIAEDASYSTEKNAGGKVSTIQKLAQLTGTGTWARNLWGNGSFGVIDLLANNNPVTLLADQLASAATGKRSTGFEGGILQKGTAAASKRAMVRSILEVAANIDLDTDSSSTKYDMKRTRTFGPNGNGFERFLSRWEQWNGYMLNSSDETFKAGVRNSVEAAIIRANGWDADNLTDAQKAELRETTNQVAEYRAFQNKGIAADMANSARDFFNFIGFGGEGKTHKGGFGLGTALTPYTTVPTNIGVKALEFSPAGAVKGIAELAKVMTDPNATMAQQNKAVTDFGRGVTGTMAIAALAMLMKNIPFFKDWENEDDKNVKAQNRAEGKSGMQFNIDMIRRFADGDKSATWRNGDRTVDISSVEPLNQILTAASLMAEGKDFSEAVLSSATENFMQLPSVTALKNIEDTIKYTSTPDDLWQTLIDTAASTAGGMAGGFVPAPLRHLATVTDEWQRDTSGSNSAERALHQVMSAIPGLREHLPVKTDSWGRELKAGDAATRALTTYGAFRYTEVNQSEASREAERLRNETGGVLTPARNAPSSEKFGSEKVKLSAEERKDWKDQYGQDLDAVVSLLLRNPVYQNADDTTKAEMWSNIEPYVKDGVKDAFADSHGLSYKSQYEDVREMDNPVSYLTTKKAFSIYEDSGDWDAVDSLIGPLQRMTESDAEKSREKAGDRTMWNYFDFLAENPEGYKADSAEAVHEYKEGASQRAKDRGVQAASSIDRIAEMYDGLRSGRYSDDDVKAFMSKQQSDGDWEATKGRYAIFAAAISAGAPVLEALEAAMNADTDGSGSLDEYGFKKKAKYEVSGAIKRGGYDMDEFQRIYNAGK